MKTVVSTLSILLLCALAVLGWGVNEYVQLTMVYAQNLEAREALSIRVRNLEEQLQKLSDSESRAKLAPLIAANRLACTLLDAKKKVLSSTTSLTKNATRAEYEKAVELAKGHRIVFRGKIKDVGKRIISFSQMYLSLTVVDGFDVKFIFDKDAKKRLMDMKAGQEIVIEGYVVSSGDLVHGLTVGGPSMLDAAIFDEAVRLGSAESK